MDGQDRKLVRNMAERLGVTLGYHEKRGAVRE